MHYKALMLDIDGTTIPYDFDAVPSKRVIEAINSIKNNVHVCLVTGRSIRSVRRLLKDLRLTEGYAVADGGAYIYDIKNDKSIYERCLLRKDLDLITDVLLGVGKEFYVKDEISRGKPGRDYKPFKKGDNIDNVTMVFTEEVFTQSEAEKIADEISSKTLTVFLTHHKTPQKRGLNITHSEATKLHGVAYIMQKLDLKREEIIGVGDSYNDFPLLMASGLKVAMGNAIEDLKDIADYIAPSVDDDGVADVIEKFLVPSLHKS